MGRIKDWLWQKEISRSSLRWYRVRRIASDWFMTPYLTQRQRQMLVGTGDPVRYGTLLLTFEQIAREGIVGSLAECGVYRGRLSRFIHKMLPDRKLFLFDTFEGFDWRDSESGEDDRFQDTTERAVLSNIGDAENVIIRKGYFPETAVGLEGEKFAFVMIDFDKYEPTLAALKFFYPLVTPGGFVFVHDYSSSESDRACSRALNEFLSNRPEKPILLPDGWGTALFRKV
jgi:O-methyltransferase